MMNDKQQQSEERVRRVNPSSPVCEHEKHIRYQTSALAFSLHKAVEVCMTSHKIFENLFQLVCLDGVYGCSLTYIVQSGSVCLNVRVHVY